MAAPIPPYLEAALATPTVSPLQNAIESGIGTYGQLQKVLTQRAARQEEQQREQALPQQLQNKQALQQENLKLLQLATEAMPTDISQRQQLKKGEIHAQVLKNNVAKLTGDEARSDYLSNKLADIGSLPEDQQATAYNQLLQHAKSLGEDTSDLPSTYEDRAKTAVKLAMAKSPAAAALREFQNKVFLQHMKNQGAITAAQQKEAQAHTYTPYQKEYQTIGAQEDQKYMTNLATGAAGAQQIQDDVLNIRNMARQTPANFGVVRGNWIKLSPDGYREVAATRKMVLDMFGDMKHIGRGGNVLQKTIQDSKPSVNMPYDQLLKWTNYYYMATQYAMDKNEMALFLQKNGVTNRNNIESIWNKYQKAYPIVDEKGNPNLENAGKWSKFLYENPSLVKEKGGSLSSEDTQGVHESSKRAPFIMPGSTLQRTSDITTGAPGTATTQAPVATPSQMLSPYSAANPYDNINTFYTPTGRKK